MSKSKRCPRCNSPNPRLHPSVQHEGEVQLCEHPWHETGELAASGFPAKVNLIAEVANG